MLRSIIGFLLEPESPIWMFGRFLVIGVLLGPAIMCGAWLFSFLEQGGGEPAPPMNYRLAYMGVVAAIFLELPVRGWLARLADRPPPLRPFHRLGIFCLGLGLLCACLCAVALLKNDVLEWRLLLSSEFTVVQADGSTDWNRPLYRTEGGREPEALVITDAQVLARRLGTSGGEGERKKLDVDLLFKTEYDEVHFTQSDGTRDLNRPRSKIGVYGDSTWVVTTQALSINAGFAPLGPPRSQLYAQLGIGIYLFLAGFGVWVGRSPSRDTT